MNEKDKLPSPFENWEAMEQATRDLARIVWGFYNQLREEGFAPNQALELTVEYQRSLFMLGRPIA